MSPREQLNALIHEYNHEINPIRALKLIETLRWINTGVKILEMDCQLIHKKGNLK
jgi:hypothetical protein